MKDKRKKKKFRFAIIDQFSGRSSGCHAALDIMMTEIKELYPNAVFDLYTLGFPNIKKLFPNHSGYLRKVSMNPWWMSINFLGLPVLFNIPISDVVIFRGGHLFDKKLWNPVFSYLLNFFFIIPYSKLWKKPVIAYSIGVGPFNTRLGQKMAGSTLKKVDLLITRENGSAEIIKQLVDKKVDAVLADPAYNLDPSKNLKKILYENNLDMSKDYVGINVSKYIDLMVTKQGDHPIDRTTFVNSIVKVIVNLYYNKGCHTILIPTGKENEIFQMIERIASVPVHYLDREIYHPSEIASVMKICKCFVGMRMHSLIFALSQYTPAIGIVYNQKVRFILEDSNMRDKVFEVNEFVNNPMLLYQKIVSIIDNYEKEFNYTKENIICMQNKAKEMPKKLMDFFNEYYR